MLWQGAGKLESWNKYQHTQTYKTGNNLICFVESHRSDNFFKQKVPFLLDGPSKIFGWPPQLGNLFEDLIHFWKPWYYNSNILAGDNKVKKGQFIQEMTFPTLDSKFQALIAHLDYQSSNIPILPQCQVKPISAGDFERAKLSAFPSKDIEHPTLLMLCRKLQQDPHWLPDKRQGMCVAYGGM